MAWKSTSRRRDRSSTISVTGLCLLLAIVVGLATLRVQAADEPTAANKPSEIEKSRYTYAKSRFDHDPNGIGKFYLGREIARVMGYQGAPWLERPSREKEERLSLLTTALELKPGMSVADIGAGSGVITILLAEGVGPSGQVYAVDVQDEMLKLLREKLKDLAIKNVIPVKGTQKSPNLKPESVDLVVMVDVYHEFEFPYEMLREISHALRPGGRVAFVEYRMEDPTVPIKLVHKMSEKQVRLEAEQPEFGMRFQKTIGVLPRQHIVVFEKIDPASADR